MVHTVHLDDQYVNVKKLLQEIQNQKQGVRFENSEKPEGYMTSEEFKKRVSIKVNTFCDRHGIL
jgi:hypothetical protein